MTNTTPPASRPFRFNISSKMLAGYLPLVVLLLALSGMILPTLERFSDLHTNSIQKDIPLLQTADALEDVALSQELYRRRYAILQTPDILRLFWKKSEELDEMLNKAQQLAGSRDLGIHRILALHERYNTVFMDSVRMTGQTSPSEKVQAENSLESVHQQMLALMEDITTIIQREQNRQLLQMSASASEAYGMTTALCVLGVLLGVLASLLITRNISGSIQKLRQATDEISKGNFDAIPDVRGGDELAELAVAFRNMGQRLKKLEEMYLDASPLTRLPGNVAIETILDKRLRSGAPLAFCLLDLDDFKAFNDRYGYARGSEVIKETARIVAGTVKAMGMEEDFVGHIGGDDFVIVTAPARYEEFCVDILKRFDEQIPRFYDEEDRQNGRIVSKTRQGQIMMFPIMTMSVAVVTNEQRALTNHIETGEIAAEIKAYAKSLPGSKMVVDRRSRARAEDESLNVVRMRRSNAG